MVESVYSSSINLIRRLVDFDIAKPEKVTAADTLPSNLSVASEPPNGIPDIRTS